MKRIKKTQTYFDIFTHIRYYLSLSAMRTDEADIDGAVKTSPMKELITESLLPDLDTDLEKSEAGT